MTKAELVKVIEDSTEVLKELFKKQSETNTEIALLKQSQDSHKALLNDHLHSHQKLNWWVFVFLVTTILSLIGTIYTLILNGVN